MGKTTGRRSIWDDQKAETNNPDPTLPAAAPTQAAPVGAVPVVEQLRMAQRKERNRAWERSNRAMLLRGVPPMLHGSMVQIANSLQVRTCDVARAFLEYGLMCYQRGEVQFQPVFCDQRRTLFPQSKDGWGRNQLPGWYEKIWDPQPPAQTRTGRKGSAEKESSAWRRQTSYRGIPSEVQTALRDLHETLSVPLGEVATMLLGHALNAYQEGRLVLNPHPRSAPELNFSLEK